jgi:hypothetical protein
MKSTIKPTGISKVARPQTESVKARAGQEGEDTPKSNRTPAASTGIKRPAMGIRPTTARPARSDSKESTKSKEKTAEEKKKEM